MRPARVAAVAAALLAAGAGLAVYRFGLPVAKSADAPAHHEVAPMVERLAERLRRQPDDVAGWAMLGRSYHVMGRFSEAAAAFAEAAKRSPRDAQLLADQADALAMSQGRKLAGEPEKLVARALALDPDNLKALALAGTLAFEKQDYRAALRYWERMGQHAPAGSPAAKAAAEGIVAARGRVAGGGAPSVSGTVRVSPALAAKVAPTDIVFIYARATGANAPGKPGLPLAVLRREARELPISFVLDDSAAVNPQAGISSAAQLVVLARISHSGQVARQPGDLEGESRAVAPSARGVEVLVDKQVR
jgi:cytochrome c-type biogenesis protein CcmH